MISLMGGPGTVVRRLVTMFKNGANPKQPNATILEVTDELSPICSTMSVVKIDLSFKLAESPTVTKLQYEGHQPSGKQRYWRDADLAALEHDRTLPHHRTNNAPHPPIMVWFHDDRPRNREEAQSHQYRWRWQRRYQISTFQALN
ncbi:hypothetical protein WAI453_007942 [Rhynchosporium graminicola]